MVSPHLAPAVVHRRSAWSWLRLAAYAILFGAALLVASVIGAGFYLSAPAPAVVGPPPPDLGAEAVTIASPSGAALKAWLIVGEPGAGVVVLLHGVKANRRAMVRRARLFKSAGFSVLLFDFQAHGESTGTRITFGRLEGLDAAAAVAFARTRLPGERVGAVGSSLGGAATVLGPQPLAVDALVLESVYSEIGTAIANRIRVVLGPLIGGVVAQPAAWLFEVVLPPFLGMRPADLRPIDRMTTIVAPLLLAAGTLDDRTTMAESMAMFARAPEPKALWVVEGMGHVDLEGFAPEDYRARVLTFVVERLRR